MLSHIYAISTRLFEQSKMSMNKSSVLTFTCHIPWTRNTHLACKTLQAGEVLFCHLLSQTFSSQHTRVTIYLALTR